MSLAIDTYPECFVNTDEAPLEQTVVELMSEKGLKLALAESCTGGRIASRVTDVAGASGVLTHGFVTYSNESKTEMIDVNADSIEVYGAVSKQVAEEMSTGALLKSGADIAVSVTGIAGPSGGSDEKPVGTVWVGVSVKKGNVVETRSEQKFYPQGREMFKQLVGQFALMQILTALK